MSNEAIIENLSCNTAFRNAYVLRIKKELEKRYDTKIIPLKAILIYMEKFIKKLGGNEFAVKVINQGIKDWFNNDVTLKY